MPRSQYQLDRREMKVVRRETDPGFKVISWALMFGGVAGGFVSMYLLHAPSHGGKGVFLIYGFPGYAPFMALIYLFAYLPGAAVKKALGFDPKKQNRAEGVIYHFYELRLSRTELIRGYGTDAPRIPLCGLTASVEVTGTSTDRGEDRCVHVTISGPGTNFVYSMAENSAFDFTIRMALQFAALLNYEADLQGPPPKTVLHRPAEAQAQEKLTKVRCRHCQHVQTVPVSQETFWCAECNAHLQRRAAPATGG
jgi:ribosomal protein S27E